MPATIKVTDRSKIVKNNIRDLPANLRVALKLDVFPILEKAGNNASSVMKSLTPVRIDPEELMRFREMGWKKYGQQDYLLTTNSNKPSERQLGMTLQDGWQAVDVDFLGSNQNSFQIAADIENIAPHSRMALLGEYNQSSWQIPKDKLRGGRKAMLWWYNGKPVFRWVHNETKTEGSKTGPITFNKPRNTLGWIIDKGKEVYEGYESEISEAMKTSIRNIDLTK